MKALKAKRVGHRCLRYDFAHCHATGVSTGKQRWQDGHRQVEISSSFGVCIELCTTFASTSTAATALLVCSIKTAVVYPAASIDMVNILLGKLYMCSTALWTVSGAMDCKIVMSSITPSTSIDCLRGHLVRPVLYCQSVQCFCSCCVIPVSYYVQSRPIQRTLFMLVT